MIVTESKTYCDGCKKVIPTTHGSLQMYLNHQDMSGAFVGGSEIKLDHLCKNCAHKIDKFIKNLKD